MTIHSLQFVHQNSLFSTPAHAHTHFRFVRKTIENYWRIEWTKTKTLKSKLKRKEKRCRRPLVGASLRLLFARSAPSSSHSSYVSIKQLSIANDEHSKWNRNNNNRTHDEIKLTRWSASAKWWSTSKKEPERERERVKGSEHKVRKQKTEKTVAHRCGSHAIKPILAYSLTLPIRKHMCVHRDHVVH